MSAVYFHLFPIKILELFSLETQVNNLLYVENFVNESSARINLPISNKYKKEIVNDTLIYIPVKAKFVVFNIGKQDFTLKTNGVFGEKIKQNIFLIEQILYLKEKEN